jgi:RsiW-degrading membrane proteinase PrsW (M82 family)
VTDLDPQTRLRPAPAGPGGYGAARRAGAAPTSSLVRRTWVQILVGGLILWGGLTWAAVQTQNINLVPSVIALGAFLGPVVFVAYVYERARDVPLPTLLVCFVTGGVLGVTGASVLEYRTMIDLGALPTLAIGLIEESCKLLVPLAIFAIGRYRREADGLLFGVASGMGFAAFESMGYGLTALFLSHGQIDQVEKLLFVRGVLSPAGHAAWTGLLCATLWWARELPGAAPKLAVVSAFVSVVMLHALWDAATSIYLQLAVGLVSAALLAWRLHAAGAELDATAAAPQAERS